MANSTKLILDAFSDLGKQLGDRFYFTGLKDCPSVYVGHSGDYLVVNNNESGIHFTGIEKIAQDLEEYGLIGGGQVTGFTGLYDTPSNYESGKYLISTENSLEYIDATELAKTLPVFPRDIPGTSSLPQPASDYNGEIVRVGCDLMISCDGEWKPLVSTDRLPLSEAERDFLSRMCHYCWRLYSIYRIYR